MKKYFLYFLILLILTGCNAGDQNSILQNYYYQDGIVIWSNIIFGEDGKDESISKLQEMKHVITSSINEFDYASEDISGIYFSTNPGNYHDIQIVKIGEDWISIGVIFDSLFTSESIFENIAKPEKVFIEVGSHGRDLRRIILVNREYGYILNGLNSVQDYEKLTYKLESDQKYILYLFSPEYLEFYLQWAVDDIDFQSIPEQYFHDWAGYVEYEVYDP